MHRPARPHPHPPPIIRCLDDLRACLARAAEFRVEHGRPFVVLSYAQSVDGSIAGRRRERVRLSGDASLELTHAIRTLCSAILVGIGTVIADDPSLTSRGAGRNPQPVVLDTVLRTPVTARLVQRSDAHTWFVHGEAAPPDRRAALARMGAVPIGCPVDARGRIDLHGLMRCLAGRAVDSLMVEGGARVITNFIRRRLADVFVITIGPRLMGGLPVIDPGESAEALDLRFARADVQVLGPDVVLWAQPAGESA
jgi:3,4-dihydroxy 2-butanone 4-phosphate synthase/GTP cyclohydrolase II